MLIAMPGQAQRIERAFPPEPAARFFRYTIDDGLSQGSIRSMAQDEHGFMWFGTQDGLNKFDGYTFTVYNHDPSDTTTLSDDWISALLVDSANRLWVGTRNGLNRYVPGREQFVRYGLSAAERTTRGPHLVQHIFEDNAGTLWIGSPRGLFRWDAGADSLYEASVATLHGMGPPARWVHDIHEAANGDLWVGTKGGLFRLQQSPRQLTAIDVRAHSGLGPGPPPEVRSIEEDPHGVLWIATYRDGLFVHDSGAGTYRQLTADAAKPKGITTNALEFVHRDRLGRLWIGTGGAGLIQYDPLREQFTTYRHDARDPHSLTNNQLLSFLEDRDGNLWFGALGGINRLGTNLSAFRHVRHDPLDANSLAGDFIWSLEEDAEGNIWVGSFGAGLTRLVMSTGEFERFPYESDQPGALEHSNVGALYADASGRVWIGNENQLYVHREREGRLENAFEPGDRPFGVIRAFAEDSQGRLIVAASLGVFEIETAGLELPLKGASIRRVLPARMTCTSLLDAGSVLWVGSESGLIRIDKRSGAVRTLSPDAAIEGALSNRFVTSLFRDAKGMIWVGTAKGLNRLDPQSEHFDTYTENEGLPNDYIYGILPEDESTLWVSTNRGLARVYIADSSNVRFRNYTKEDGLQGNEFNTNAYVRLANGDLLFGGTNGLTWFNPKSVEVNEAPPPVALTEFRLFNKPSAFGIRLKEQPVIHLNHHENEVSFGFAALNFRHSARNQYAYRLEGLRDDWNYIGTRRAAFFTNLNPGDYTFTVKAANNDGVWNEDGASLRLVVHPPFWQRAWFRLMMLVMLGGALYGAYRARVRKLERARQAQEVLSRRLIETQEQERARIARELHDGLGQNLLMIKNGLDHMKDVRGVDDASMDQFSEIAQETIDEMRSISSALHPHQLDRLGLQAALEAMVEKISDTIAIPIEKRVDPIDDDFQEEEAIHVYRIVQEALNNVVRHARASSIRVVVEKRPSSVTLCVEDDGQGFDRSRTKQGGMGLSGIQERVRMLGGRLTLRSAPGDGTRIDAVIPV